MTKRGGQTWAGTDAWGRSHDPGGLHLAPFRGDRFDIAQVEDPASLTAPPYDVIDADVAHDLQAAHPHNIVRLILPEGDRDAPDGRYAQAARTLQDWRRRNILVTDPEPALYVYEQSGPSTLQRGLLGAVGLHRHEDEVIIAHEDTMPGPVEDRLRLMTATRANLEPIFLLYHGDGSTAALIEKIVTTEPVLELSTSDGLTHRLWQMTEPADVLAVNQELAPKQALIADGHHRYATYLRMQEAARAAGRGPGPWDQGLALLVDVEAYPPQVGAIHRVVHGLPFREAVERARQGFTIHAQPSTDEGRRALAESTGSHPFLLTSGDESALVSDPDEGLLADTLPKGPTEAWRHLDATVLHATLLDRIWGVGDGAVSYHHTVESALRATEVATDTAVLLNPVGVGEVLEVTAAGERMPRKSTSFGPKPRTGLVLRRLDQS